MQLLSEIKPTLALPENMMTHFGKLKEAIKILPVMFVKNNVNCRDF